MGLILAIGTAVATVLFITWIMWDCDQDAQFWYEQSRRKDREDL